MKDTLYSCIPIIIGAFIAIFPTWIEKRNEQKYSIISKLNEDKQKLYIQLIYLFGKVLRDKEDYDIEELQKARRRSGRALAHLKVLGCDLRHLAYELSIGILMGIVRIKSLNIRKENKKVRTYH